MTTEHVKAVAISESSRRVIVAMINEAAANASRSLQRLTNNQVEVGVTRLEVGDIDRVLPELEAEAMVAGVCLQITGDIRGWALLIFPVELANEMCDRLLKREVGTTSRLSELDKSALKEVGNILCGSFLTGLSNRLKIKIVESPPEFCLDMFGAVVDGVLGQVARHAESALGIQVAFEFKESVVAGQFILFFGVDEMIAVVKTLEEVAEAE